MYVLTRLVFGVAEGASRRPSSSGLDGQQLTQSLQNEQELRPSHYCDHTPLATLL